MTFSRSIRSAVNTRAHQLGRAYEQAARRKLQAEIEAAIEASADQDALLKLIDDVAAGLEISDAR